MNSNLTALTCRDILRLIFKRLDIPDLARASCVCSEWNSVGSDKEVQSRAFRAPWRLKEVVGNPSNGSFWRDNGIGKFAISHKLNRGDSIAGLAVKYSVQVMDIKRLNNMMSDHGIHSRERLLIPISNPYILVNSTCYIEMDNYAKREVGVLYLDGGPDRELRCLLGGNGVSGNRGKRRLLDAQYYLSISNGDPRAAMSEFSEDLRWERDARLA
ncbi:LysM domain [Dillenia turbinata]|uniref:LysM domain n=1 Tax=Dillenia turbinata TaxID=194707 RepID=A0AAN8UPJ7_9MAGN